MSNVFGNLVSVAVVDGGAVSTVKTFGRQSQVMAMTVAGRIEHRFAGRDAVALSAVLGQLDAHAADDLNAVNAQLGGVEWLVA